MEWFLIKQNEHLGPFSEDAIHQLFSTKEIDGATFVWTEGWKDARSYHDVFLSEEFEKIINDEENFVESDDIIEDPVQIKTEIIQGPDLTDLPPDLPPIPDDVIIPEKVVKTTKRVKSEKIVPKKKVKKATPLDQDVESGNKSFFKKVKLIVGILLLVSVAVPSFLYYQSQTSLFSRPKLMTMRDYKKLKRTAMSEVPELKFSFALSKDKKSIWISTNNPSEGEVYVHMKSVTNRSLGKTVEFTASGVLENKLVVLNQFQFIKGSRFVDGLYSVELSTTEKLNTPLHHKFFTKHNTEFKYVDQAVVTSLSIKDFKRQLGKYIKMKKSNSNEFWIEITEKYKTVKMITGQIRDGILDIFKGEAKNWNLSVLEFENKYKTNWGQFFTAFVKANELSYKRYVSEKVEEPGKVLAVYNNLSKLAIMIGEESMGSLEAIQAFDGKEEANDKKQILQDQSVEKLNEIIKKCESKILEIKTY
jgi:hypothetical protein